MLHPSVATRWWLYHLPHAGAARRFRDEIVPAGQVELIAVDTIDLEILDALARDLSPLHLAATIAGALCEDVLSAFGPLVEHRVLRTVSQRILARPAFLLASLYDIPFADALAVTLAEDARDGDRALLVGDDAVYATLARLQADRPGFRLMWLPDYAGR